MRTKTLTFQLAVRMDQVIDLYEVSLQFQSWPRHIPLGGGGERAEVKTREHTCGLGLSSLWLRAALTTRRNEQRGMRIIPGLSPTHETHKTHHITGITTTVTPPTTPISSACRANRTLLQFCMVHLIGDKRSGRATFGGKQREREEAGRALKELKTYSEYIIAVVGWWRGRGQ